jgi:hypothetical protein
MQGFALKATMGSIVALTTTLIGPIAVFGPVTSPGSRSSNALIQQAHVALDSSLGQPCLIGTPSCLSLDQKAPAPCLVSTERCQADGRVIKLVNSQSRRPED